MGRCHEGGLGKVKGGAVRNEQQSLWAALPQDVQDECLQLASAKHYEQQKSAHLLDRLRVFFKALFQVEHEQSVVRLLCIQLDYLQPSAPSSLLTAEACSADLLVHEGNRGSLELLHPCPHDASLTKYQASFDPDPMFDRYRMAFFMNAANQHGEGSDWLLGAMDITAEHIAQEWPEGSQLLLAARNTLKERQGCYGYVDTPMGCTQQLAWATFKTLLLGADYYFNLQVFLCTRGWASHL